MKVSMTHFSNVNDHLSFSSYSGLLLTKTYATLFFIFFFTPADCYCFLPEFVSQLSTIPLKITICSFPKNYTQIQVLHFSRSCISCKVLLTSQGVQLSCYQILKCLHSLKTQIKGLGAVEHPLPPLNNVKLPRISIPDLSLRLGSCYKPYSP